MTRGPEAELLGRINSTAYQPTRIATVAEFAERWRREVLSKRKPSTVLRDYQAAWKENSEGYLFVSRNGRPPSSNKIVEYHLWPVLDALNIPRCGLHAFHSRRPHHHESSYAARTKVRPHLDSEKIASLSGG